MQFPDFRGVYSCRSRSPQPFSILPRMRQARPRSFPQNLPFELREDGKQAGHGATGRRGQVQCLGQRHEAHTEMLQFL